MNLRCLSVTCLGHGLWVVLDLALGLGFDKGLSLDQGLAPYLLSRVRSMCCFLTKMEVLAALENLGLCFGLDQGEL